MTDPVDTDALRIVANVTDQDRSYLWASAAFRAAADELDRLRAAVVEARAASDRYSLALSEYREQSMLNEGRLRAVIENAPHGRACRWLYATSQPCTCWKADAL